MEPSLTTVSSELLTPSLRGGTSLGRPPSALSPPLECGHGLLLLSHVLQEGRLRSVLWELLMVSWKFCPLRRTRSCWGLGTARTPWALAGRMDRAWSWGPFLWFHLCDLRPQAVSLLPSYLLIPLPERLRKLLAFCCTLPCFELSSHELSRTFP